MLTINNISKALGDFKLGSISFEQQALQKIAITGESGSGKSTLLKIIGGLLDADTGEVYFEAKKVTGPAYNLVPGYKGISYLSQHFELRNHYRMEELLEYANELSDDEAKDLYELCRIGHLMKRRTEGLSGGEKQRIALAKILVSNPRLLLLDEPFSNLDLPNKTILKQILQELHQYKKVSCILTSHDPTDTLPWADTMIVMQQGRILQQGKPAEVYTKPLNEYVAGTQGSYNLLSGDKLSTLFPDQKGGLFKKAMIRPEHISISKSGKGKDAVITHISFGGHYNIVQLQIGAHQYIAHTLNNTYKNGDTVFVTVSPEHLHYLQ
jgi:ABC-type sugar transport system ATPase subunit